MRCSRRRNVAGSVVAMPVLQQRVGAGCVSIVRAKAACRRSPPARGRGSARASGRDAHAVGAVLTPWERCSQRGCDARAAAEGRHRPREHRACQGSVLLLATCTGPGFGAGAGSARGPGRCSHRGNVAHGVGAMPLLQQRVGTGCVSIVQATTGAGALATGTGPGQESAGLAQRDPQRVWVTRSGPVLWSPLPRRGRPAGVTSAGQPQSARWVLPPCPDPG